MFSRIGFTMKNSVGIPVSVNLYNDNGIVEYEILFGNPGDTKAQRKSMGRGGSDRFLRRLKRLGLVELIVRYEFCGLDKEGDFWRLSIELEDGRTIDLSGPELNASKLYPLIQDFSELLDQQFQITQYVSPSRIDRMEVEFIYNELDPDFRDVMPDYDECLHTESISLERSSKLLTYTKRFPAGCFHSTYECKCENQVRQILDQTTAALRDDCLFEDIFCPPSVPQLVFSFTYHDGEKVSIRRSLSPEGLRDGLYIEMIDVLYETLLHLMFKQSLFDKRFLLPKGREKEAPFFVVYSESEDFSYFRELASYGDEQCS